MSISYKKRLTALILVPVLIFTIIITDVQRVKASVLGAVLAVGIPVMYNLVSDVEKSTDYQSFYEHSFQPAYREWLYEGMKSIGFIPS